MGFVERGECSMLQRFVLFSPSLLDDQWYYFQDHFPVDACWFWPFWYQQVLEAAPPVQHP